MSAFAQYAGEYANAGIVVFPVDLYGDNEKKPLVKWGNMKLPPVANTISEWANKWPDKGDRTTGIGIATGPSKLTVVDIDDEALIDETRQRFGITPVEVTTPRGGRHLYYRGTGESSKTQFEGQKIDIRAVGGFLVAPHSVRSDGRQYLFCKGSIEDIKHLPTVPDGLLKKAASTMTSHKQAHNDSGTVIPNKGEVHKGERNDFIFSKGLKLAWKIDGEKDLFDILSKLNNEYCTPPLPDSEVQKITKSVWKYKTQGKLIPSGKLYSVVLGEEIERWGWEKPRALTLLLYLRANHHGVRDEFAVSPHAMSRAERPPWSHVTIRNAIEDLVKVGALVKIHHGGNAQGDPNLYKFG